MKKIHFLYGCPWADGSLQQSDTIQTHDWQKVTCYQCLKLKSTGYGKKKRAKRYDWNSETDMVRDEFLWSYDESMAPKENTERK